MGNTILVATDETKDKEIAKLKAACDDYEKAKKANDEEHEKEVAKLKADLNDRIAEHGPGVKAIVEGMDDEKKESAEKIDDKKDVKEDVKEDDKE